MRTAGSFKIRPFDVPELKNFLDEKFKKLVQEEKRMHQEELGHEWEQRQRERDEKRKETEKNYSMFEGQVFALWEELHKDNGLKVTKVVTEDVEDIEFINSR